MKDIWKLSAIIKGCSVPFEKTLKFWLSCNSWGINIC